MKKHINLIIWITAAILVVIAIYVTTNYNKNPIPNITADSNTSAQGTIPQSDINQGATSTTDNTVGQKAPDFELTDLNGNKISLSSLKGKNVYINFWTTWCPWCIKELPDIEKAYQTYKDKDLVVLAIDIGEDRNTVKQFIDKNKYNFKVLLDTDQSVAQLYNVTSIPVSVFIDKNGNISAKRIGALTEDQLKSYIESLIKK